VIVQKHLSLVILDHVSPFVSIVIQKVMRRSSDESITGFRLPGHGFGLFVPSADSISGSAVGIEKPVPVRLLLRVVVPKDAVFDVLSQARAHLLDKLAPEDQLASYPAREFCLGGI